MSPSDILVHVLYILAIHTSRYIESGLLYGSTKLEKGEGKRNCYRYFLLINNKKENKHRKYLIEKERT